MHIANLAACATYGVMMIVNIGVKAHAALTKINQLQLTHLGEFIERLIHRS